MVAPGATVSLNHVLEVHSPILAFQPMAVTERSGSLVIGMANMLLISLDSSIRSRGSATANRYMVPTGGVPSGAV